MTDPLMDAETEAQQLLAAAAKLETLEAELAAAHELLATWRESVVSANRISQSFEARARKAEAEVVALSLPLDPPGEYARGYAQGLKDGRDEGVRAVLVERALWQIPTEKIRAESYRQGVDASTVAVAQALSDRWHRAHAEAMVALRALLPAPSAGPEVMP